MDNDLLRQRRNLIGISVALLLLRFPDNPIEGIDVLGAHMKVSSAYSLPAFAAVLLLYFLVRYYQYLKAAGDLGIWSSVEHLYRQKISQHISRKSGETTMIGEIVFKRDGVHWKYHLRDRKKGARTLPDTPPEQLPLFQSWFWWLQASGYITARTTKITDYVLPYLLASAAAIQLTVGLIH